MNPWIDAESIYGSSAEVAKKLRTYVKGKLKLYDENLLSREGSMRQSGDTRVN